MLKLIKYILIFQALVAMPLVSMAQTSCNNDGKKDPGEECDLGPGLNNGSWGCDSDCKQVDGWDCTKNMTEYNQRVQEANDYYTDLSAKSTSGGSFDTNGCVEFLSTTNEIGCYDYQESLRKFKQLNVVIKVDCAAAGAQTTLKERKATPTATVPTPYNVNCK